MSTDRLIWVDTLRLVAGLSMVGLHATADPNGQAWPAYDVGDRVAPLVLRAIVYTARTELFLIISVFLLLLALDRRPRGYGKTVLEQSKRLLVPFAFWTVFFALYNLLKAGAFGYLEPAVSELSQPQAWVSFFLLGSVKYHMHFLPTLFGLVLLYPIFRIAQRTPVLGSTVVVFLLLKQELDAYLYKNYWGEEALPYFLRLVKIVTYAGYGLCAGAFLGIWQRVSVDRRSRWILPILGLGAFLFALKLMTTWQSIETGRWVFDDPFGYWADFLVPVVLFAGCLALGHKKWPRVISVLAPYSFGIYLSHPIFLDLCEVFLRETQLAPIEQVLMKICVTVLATSLFVAALARSGFGAWTIGMGPLPFRQSVNRKFGELQS